ncbi:MAG: tetratricopeptide repeat protein [Cyanobacteriota bacterium]|nr:tetratricopeptide repeat protein [Cyanobacteriota bacterium]
MNLRKSYSKTFLLSSFFLLGSLVTPLEWMGGRESGWGIPDAIAQDSQDNSANPLEINESDPLIPTGFLTPLRLNSFEEELERLNARAIAELAEENGNAAFVIWYRELRLRRQVLGRLEEVKALGRIGDIAWQESRTADIKLITKRLETIQSEVEAEGSNDLAILSALARSYEQVRGFKQAAQIYDFIVAYGRAENDIRTLESALKAQGELYLIWFDYPSAALIYEQLLALARQQFDDFSAVEYLEQLAYIYDRSIDSEDRENVKAVLIEKAIEVKRQLLASYAKKEEIAKYLATKISIAEHDEALDRPEVASQGYQEAFELAWQEKQFERASEALQKLGELYQKYDQLDYAIQIYEEQVKVQTITGDRYGLMNTYDRIGLIYFDRENYAKALDFFQSGLELATFLDYREAYFQTQIDRSLQQNEAS